MISEAAAVGLYSGSDGKSYAKLQLLTINDLLEGKNTPLHPDYQPGMSFAKAPSEILARQREFGL